MTGEELRRQRESLGLTQEQAAAQVEKSWRTWARYEASQRVPEHAVKLFEIENGLRRPSRQSF